MDFPRNYNAATDFVDRNIDEGRSDKAAFIDPDRTLTYGQLQETSCQMANLLTTLGVRREARVAMIMLDTVDFPITFWGTIRAGIIPVPLNTLLNANQYDYMLRDSRAEVLVISAALLPTVQAFLPEIDNLKHVIVSGGDAGPYLALQNELANHGEVFHPADTLADEVAFWLYSSGSTGNPKGVQHVHTSAMITARNYARDVLAMSEDDVVYSAAKLFFAYGLGNAMTFTMATGATATLLPGRPTPQSVFETLKNHQPTLFFGVPTLYAAMLADPACAPENGSQRLRHCISAGEALPEDVATAWKAKFGLEILDGIGSTELLHIFLSNRPGDFRYGTTGKAVPGYELKLLDDDGAELGADEIGELVVRGDTAATGYWNQRAKSRTTFEGAWTRTGDKYYRDADGFYHYCGRTDDMFKVSGIWVSPFEVESALVSHEAVLEAAVVAKEDGEGLLKPKAFVVLNQGQDGSGLFDTLKEHVKQEVGGWKYPRWIDFVDDLPKTATGKIQRFKLRD
ncbi:MAG: benzoate-CoA ligase family protein [Alphaproteobacteria bacterium]|nr:benzoate-CoA ligase family protein [Alphaproteobacteria bacterium]